MAAFLAYLLSWTVLTAGALWTWCGARTASPPPDTGERTGENLLGMALQAASALPVVLWLDAGPLRPGNVAQILIAVLAPLASAMFVWALRAGRAGGLVTGGPFSLVRHPVYLSFFAMLLATGLLASAGVRTFVAAALYLAGTELRIRTEEPSLANRFGQEYSKYQNRVRWCYIPGLR